MSKSIMFFQSTVLGGYHQQVGLSDLLLTHLTGLAPASLFKQTQIVVPNQAMATWIKDQIAIKSGICANLDCIVLFGPVLEKIYKINFPNAQFFDFNQAKFLIYAYLCQEKISCSDADEINNYLYPAGALDKLRAFQLACQLQSIFHEYLFLRTSELLNLKRAKFKAWQKLIWQKILIAIGTQKTFLDIYTFFAKCDIHDLALKLPDDLFVFGLTSIYPSQLEIILKLAERINVYWYYQTCSHNYYGDLLSVAARAKLEKKFLRKPELDLDDLYLSEGNPLLANLGQQSREFIELLRANDINIYDFNAEQFNSPRQNDTFLGVIQQDIREIKYRIRREYRLNADQESYIEPFNLITQDLDLNHAREIFDLPAQQTSISVNVCHNRMREVQVMFNYLVECLNKNPNLNLSDILVTAPDIDDYAPYIEAVLANEQVQRVDGSLATLEFSITGNRRHVNYKILDTILLILNTPYHLPVSYLLEILMQAEIQANLALSRRDILLLKHWLAENRTNFGYAAADYAAYGYVDYPIHSFKQFLMNIALGSCLNTEILSSAGHTPIYQNQYVTAVPYDNLDYAQIDLANKLITLINLLENWRSLLYIDALNLREINILEFRDNLTKLQASLISNDEALLISNDFIGSLSMQPADLTLNLEIINLLVREYAATSKNKLTFSGKITCASMQYMRNIPFRIIYVLGMNFSEYPSIYRPNQLSLLASDWALADRNYTVEDKQIFLDLLLAARERIAFSYIGRKETDNSQIKPSPVLSLLITTLGQSFTNFWQTAKPAEDTANNAADQSNVLEQEVNFKNIVQYHSLHPFYNNRQQNYSRMWYQVAKATLPPFSDRRWNFQRLSPLKLSSTQLQQRIQVNLATLTNTFLYANCNLHKQLGITKYNNQDELLDTEDLDLVSTNLAKSLYKIFEQYAPLVPQEELKQYLLLTGVLAYQHLGDWQFNYYFKLYQIYVHLRGECQVKISLKYNFTKTDSESVMLQISDSAWIEQGYLIVCEQFALIKDAELVSKFEALSYGLKMRGLILAGLISAPDYRVDGSAKTLAGVKIRQINARGEKRDFVLNLCDPEHSLRKIIAYYLRSLSNPVLIHKPAINEYAKASVECYVSGKLKNTPLMARNKAESKYIADWQNYDLERLRLDPVFAGIADDYIDVIQEVNGLDDIAQIGKLLSGLTGLAVKS